MNLYGEFQDYSLYLFDLGAIDHTLIESLAEASSMNSSKIGGPEPDRRNRTTTSSPPKHRHDGSSPLPLGMDWSPPPRMREGRNSVWPHDFRTGWSYCVTIPSWTIIPKARGLDPIVFYRVRVGIQSPEGITSSRQILRRFSDFLKLSSDLKREFPKKRLPPAPSKGLLRMKSKDLIEERRCILGDWIEKMLSDIDLSRSVPVALFLELEAAARSSFYVANQNSSDENSPTGFVVPSDGMLNYFDDSLVAGRSCSSAYGNDSAYDASELGTPRLGSENSSELGVDNATCVPELNSVIIVGVENDLSINNDVEPPKVFVRGNGKIFDDDMSVRVKESVIDLHTLASSTMQDVSCHEVERKHASETDTLGHARRVSRDSLESEISSVRLEVPENAEVSQINDFRAGSDLFPFDLSIVVPVEEQYKMNRILMTMQQRLNSARTDMEDLIARLNQEIAARKHLSTKVQDLEIELETRKLTGEQNLQQAIIVERERVTQVQWDMDELRRKCMEMESKLKREQEEKIVLESTKKSISLDNDRLRLELDVAKEQFAVLLKQNGDLEIKSKSDLRILAKEVKSLRSSHSELRQELVEFTKKKNDLERILQEERQRREHSNAANAKLLRECGILRRRLEECSINFLIEEEKKLTTDTSTPSEAVDILATSDNRIGLLLAGAHLLAEDVENIATSVGGGLRRTPDDELRKMLTDVLIDNASLRTQSNSIIRHAIASHEPEKDGGGKSSGESLFIKFLDR